ncbi:MAG TPA: hypothetical protein VMX38_04850 [Verrucomicrobiae bacterium]|nr:hypothetical protein [Verrucomicrobiae bacterium]
MHIARFFHQQSVLVRTFVQVMVFCCACVGWACTQTVTAVCNPQITADQVVDTPAQRLAAGDIAQPPLTDTTDGFAWPDTPLGVVKLDGQYAFFGSDGGLHSRQLWQGQWYGNNKYGSITRTLGTLDNPLGSQPPVDVTIKPNPDPDVNPYYGGYDYMGGGPVYKVPAGMPGAGDLLMLYHAEIPTITTQSFYSVLALATSTDEGMSWTDLGEIIRVNQGYRTDLDGFDIGDSTLVTSPDGRYFYIFFPDWRANGSTHWGNSITSVSVARAPIASVLKAAFGPNLHAAAFEKYYAGWNLDQGLGGYSESLDPTQSYGGNLQVAYNSAIQRYQLLLNAGVVLYYMESPDGLHWSPLTLFYDFRTLPGQPSVYAAFVGMGDDPTVLGKQFFVFWTSYPNNGLGWSGASVNRFTVACE